MAKKGYVYPWASVAPGKYFSCDEHGNDPVPVEIMLGEGDFNGQMMFRWRPGTNAGRLAHEMPKTAILMPADAENVL